MMMMIDACNGNNGMMNGVTTLDHAETKTMFSKSKSRYVDSIPWSCIGDVE